MLINTGYMSFGLGIFFIVISLIGIIAAYFLAKKSSIDLSRLEKVIDLGKWFIVSVAITLSASIVNDGFRERDQDIKEMEVFDKYTSVILEANGLEKRKLLSEFFACVSPEGAIKSSWESYDKAVSKHIDELTDAQLKAVALAEKEGEGIASAKETEERIRLVERASTLNQSLLPSSDLKPRIYFHIRSESQREKAGQLANSIESNANVTVPGIQRLDAGPSTSELRYFKSVELDEAKRMSEILSTFGIVNKLIYISGFESSTKIRPKHFELWLSNNAFSK